MVSFERNHFCQLFIIISFFITTFYTTEIHAKEHIIEFSSVEQTETFLHDNKHNIKRVRYTYDSDILIGAAVEFVDEKIAQQILFHHSDIIQHWPIQNRIKQQAPIISRSKHSFKNNGSSSLEEDEVEDNNVVATFTLQRNDTLRVLTQSNYIYENLSSNGAGIKVGIIDSGIDYTLPALGGCFGPKCKVAYGYDLVGNNYDGSAESILESNDPMDNCPNSTTATGHGTFIAGIISAEDKELNWTGVAPGATLGMWRVYGCKSQNTPDDVLIKAMEMAYKAKMDVINLSIGVLGGWSETALSSMADRLVSQGVHVIAASGNSGASGIFLTASPATGRNVIATGSITNTHVPGYTLKLYDRNTTHDVKNTIEIPYRTYVNSPLVLSEILPLVPSGKHFNAKDDACHNLTSSHHVKNNHFNGSIVLIHSGGCSPLQKIMHARDVGAKAVILYTDISNDTTTIEGLDNAVLPAAFINNDDGKIAFESSKAQFTNILIAMETPEAEVNSVSSFSTLGPTNELELKPELMAIGENVFSTLPRYLKSYGFRSGTSFSTPYITGSVALFLSNTKRDSNPNLVKGLLMNSASQVRGPISAIHYGDSPIRQGAGIIHVAQAIKNYNQFYVSPAKLSLNDTKHFEKDHVITVYNQNTEKESTFEITHLPSLTATGYSLVGNGTNFTPVEPIGLFGQDHSVAKVTFSTSKLVIPAGQSHQVRVHIKPPNLFSLDSHAIYGGYISITEKTQQQRKITVPYFGMIGNMHDLPILDRSTNPSPIAPYTFPSIGLANEDGVNILKPNDVGHFHIQHRVNASAIGGPSILVRLLTGTKILQFQILSKHGRVIGDVPIDGSRYYMVRNTLVPSSNSGAFYSWSWQGDYVPTDVTLTGSNQDYEPKLLTSGTYRLKIRGLRVYGNIDNKKDWDEWTSPKLMLKIDK